MSQQIRRALALVTLVSALFLALPAPSYAAGLRDWQPAHLVARVWSWLEQLGLIPRQTETPAGRWEKQGSLVDPDGKPSSGSTPPASTTSDQGSLVDPDGRK